MDLVADAAKGFKDIELDKVFQIAGNIKYSQMFSKQIKNL